MIYRNYAHIFCSVTPTAVWKTSREKVKNLAVKLKEERSIEGQKFGLF